MYFVHITECVSVCLQSYTKSPTVGSRRKNACQNFWLQTTLPKILKHNPPIRKVLLPYIYMICRDSALPVAWVTNSFCSDIQNSHEMNLKS